MDAIRITEPTRHQSADMFGVWHGRKPLGRIRRNGNAFRAFTNKRAPGNAYLGTFATKNEAAARVAREHGIA